MPQVVQPLGRFPAFYGTRRLINAFKRALHLCLSWARAIQSTTLNSRSILMLPIHLRLGVPSGLFPSGFPTYRTFTTRLWNTGQGSSVRDVCKCLPGFMASYVIVNIFSAMPTLKTGAVRSTKVPVPIFEIILLRIPEDCALNFPSCYKLRRPA
jgi:hypothetical protein